jgi:predicted small secreted protein
MERRRRLTLILLAALAVLAGCNGAGGGADVGGDGAGHAETAVEAEAEPREDDAGGDRRGGDADSATAGQADADTPGRSIIRTGEVRLRVDEYESATSNLTALAERRDGYVSDSAQRVHDRGGEDWTTGRVVLRVPAEDFSATITEIEREGTVLESRTSSEDVTEQVVDLEARLENLRAERDRLRTLYDRANDTEDVIAVERRLSEVQTEIERTEARLQNVQRRIAYATITVELVESRPDHPAPDRWYDTPAVAAFLESVDGVGVLLRAVVVGTAYAMPYLFVGLAPVAVVAALLYWLRDRLL